MDGTFKLKIHKQFGEPRDRRITKKMGLEIFFGSNVLETNKTDFTRKSGTINCFR